MARWRREDTDATTGESWNCSQEATGYGAGWDDGLRIGPSELGSGGGSSQGWARSSAERPAANARVWKNDVGRRDGVSEECAVPTAATGTTGWLASHDWRSSRNGDTQGRGYARGARWVGGAGGEGCGRGRAAVTSSRIAPALRPGAWQLIYWPCYARDGSLSAGAGRAEYVRLMFEEAGVPYEELEDTDFVRNFFWRSATEMQPMPVLAPPAIHRDGFVLAQTASIVRYLAREFGLLPHGEAEVEARADQVVETVHELVAEARIAFHPDHTHKKSYKQQVEAARPYIQAFERSRFPKFLAHFERLLAVGGDYFMGGSFSYVDVQVFAVLRVSESQFPAAYARQPIPHLLAFCERVKARPNIAAYLASDRCRPFAGESFM